MTDADWSAVWNFGWATMTEPIVGAPFDPANPADADWVAVGAGQLVFVSKDFATSWPAGMRITLPGGAAAGDVFALAFASTTRLFVGTTRGLVFRADRSGSAWSLTRLDDAAAGALGLDGLLSDIAVDWGDPALRSAYVAFGGMGDRAPGLVVRRDAVARAQRRGGRGRPASTSSTMPWRWTARHRTTCTPAPTWGFGTPPTAA